MTSLDLLFSWSSNRYYAYRNVNNVCLVHFEYFYHVQTWLAQSCMQKLKTQNNCVTARRLQTCNLAGKWGEQYCEMISKLSFTQVKSPWKTVNSYQINSQTLFTWWHDLPICIQHFAYQLMHHLPSKTTRGIKIFFACNSTRSRNQVSQANNFGAIKKVENDKTL